MDTSVDGGANPPQRPPSREPIVVRPPRAPLVSTLRPRPTAPAPQVPPPNESPTGPTGGGLFQNWWLYAILAVPVSSLLGLLRPMVRGGGGIWATMWSANLWADLVFIVGTVGTFWLSAVVASGKGRPSGGRFVGAAALAMGASYVTYLAGASLAQESILGQAGFVALRPSFEAAGFAEIVIQGLPGLVAMAFAGPLVGLFLPRRPAPDGTDGD